MNSAVKFERETMELLLIFKIIVALTAEAQTWPLGQPLLLPVEDEEDGMTTALEELTPVELEEAPVELLRVPVEEEDEEAPVEEEDEDDNKGLPPVEEEELTR